MTDEKPASTFYVWAERWIGVNLFGRYFGWWRQYSKVHKGDNLFAVIHAVRNDPSDDKFWTLDRRFKVVEVRSQEATLLGTFPFIVAQLLRFFTPEELENQSELWIAWPAERVQSLHAYQVCFGDSQESVRAGVVGPAVTAALPTSGFAD